MAGPDPRDWLVPFTWHGVTGDNKKMIGKLVCTARALQISAPDTTDPIRVYTSPQTFDIVDGVCTGHLLASDFPGNSNQGFTWHIVEEVTNGTGNNYDVEVPIALQSAGLLLGNIAPTLPTTGVPAAMVSYDMYAAQQAQIDQLTALVIGSNDGVTYDYEDAGRANGDPVTLASPGTISITGSPVYSTAAGLHLNQDSEVGDIALGIDGTTAGGVVQYRCPNGSGGTGQLYFRLRSPIAPSNPAQIWRTRDATDQTILRLQVFTSGKIGLFDGGSAALGPKTNHVLVPDEWNRVDWMISLGPAGPQIEWRFFYGNNVETTNAGDSFSWTLPPPPIGIPAKYAFGNGGGTVGTTPPGVWMQFDTLTLTSSALTWPNPYAPVQGLPKFVYGSSAPGASPSTDVTVAIQYDSADAGRQVTLARSTSPSMSSPVFYSVQTIDVDGWATHGHLGLSPNTQYYFQPATEPAHVLFGEVITAKTCPGNTGAWSRKWHLGSCLSNKTVYGEAAATDVLAWGPDGNVLTGDDGYWGGSIKRHDPPTKDMAKYIAVYGTKFPVMRQVLQMASTVGRCMSDHELYDNTDYNNPAGSGGGGGSGTVGDGDCYVDRLMNPADWPDGQGPGIHESLQSKRQLLAWQKMMPIVQWGDTRNPRRGRYYSYNMGAKVKIIVLDFRSPDRSNTYDVDGPNKTMLGATQLGWLFSQLDQHRLNVIVFETNWTGDPIVGAGGETDKPHGYGTERAKIGARIAGTDSVGIVYPTVMLGGDRHYVGYHAASTNPYGNFPIFIGSGWEKNGLPLYAGENPTWAYGWVASPDINQPVVGYMQITISDDGANHISVNGTARVALSAGLNASPPDPTIVTPSGMSTTVSWTIT